MDHSSNMVASSEPFVRGQAKAPSQFLPPRTDTVGFMQLRTDVLTALVSVVGAIAAGCGAQKYEAFDVNDVDRVVQESPHVIEGTVVEADEHIDFLAMSLWYMAPEHSCGPRAIEDWFGYKWGASTMNCRIRIDKVVKGNVWGSTLSLRKYRGTNTELGAYECFSENDRVVVGYDRRFLDSFSGLRVAVRERAPSPQPK
jgi:hypothetical protein